MKKISSLEYNATAWLVMRAGLVGITMSILISHSKQDAWISALLGIILGVIPLLTFIGLKNFKGEMNFSRLTQYAFGKVGKIINIITIIAIFIFIQIMFYDLIYFIRSQFLYKTSSIVISIIFITPLIYGLIKGINAITKTNLILFYIVISTIIFITLGLVGGINIENLKPSFITKTSNLIYGTLIFICYNVLPAFLLLSIPKNKIENYKIKKTFLIYFLATLSVLNAIFLTITVYGVNLSVLFEYPEFQLLKKVAIGEFISKMEGILSMEWVLSFFVLIVTSLYFIQIATKDTFNLKEKTSKIIIIIICLFLPIINPFIFNENGEALDFVRKNLPFILYTSFFFIPLITLIVSKAKTSLKPK